MNGEAIALHQAAILAMQANQQDMQDINAKQVQLAELLERAAGLQLGVTQAGARSIQSTPADGSQGTVSV
jgi:hypothetical protein